MPHNFQEVIDELHRGRDLLTSTSGTQGSIDQLSEVISDVSSQLSRYCSDNAWIATINLKTAQYIIDNITRGCIVAYSNANEELIARIVGASANQTLSPCEYRTTDTQISHKASKHRNPNQINIDKNGISRDTPSISRTKSAVNQRGTSQPCNKGAELDLDQIYQKVKNLDGKGIDKLFSSLSDEELKQLMKSQYRHEVSLPETRWTPEKSQDYLDSITTKASKNTADRVAKYIMPGPLPEIYQSKEGGGRKWELLEGQLYCAGSSLDTGISANDIRQGALGDCWLLSSMMTLANNSPSSITDIISRNYDGNYIVTLWYKKLPYKYILTQEMVIEDDGQPAYASTPDAPPYKLWPLILEKAMAMHTRKFTDTNRGSYEKLNGNDPAVALNALTGRQAVSQPINSTADANVLLEAAVHSVHQGGGAVASTENTLNKGQKETNPYYLPGGLLGNYPLIRAHAYAIVDADLEGKTLTLQNPHGPDRPKITLTYQQAKEALGWISVIL